VSAYEELAERCYKALWADGKYNGVDVVLAEVLRTLETVTPEIVTAAFGGADDENIAAFRKLLRASPLVQS
jgi:hypothetical protein